MTTAGNVDRKLARALAFDEAFHTLEKHQINRQRVVFTANDEKRTGGYGIVRQAHLHASSYLPTWFASRRYGQPQLVAVKEIKLSGMHDSSDLKRTFTKEVLVWSRLKAHPGIAKFLGFCVDFGHSEAWLMSPWEPHGNVREFILGRDLEVPEKLLLVYDTIDALMFLHQLDPPVCHGDIKSIMTGELPYEEAKAELAIICKIFQSPYPKVNGESRLHDCLLVWELMTRCWAIEPPQRPTSTMCKTTIEYLPHCPPTLKTADPHTCSAALLENLGDLESWKGNHKTGFAYLEQALHLYEEEGNDKGIASVLRKQAVAASRDSDHVKAMTTASAALEKFRSLQNDIGIATSLFQIGCSFMMEDRRVDALRNLQESLKIFRARGSSVGLARCLRGLGELYQREGLSAKALSTLKEGVDTASRCGDKLGEVDALMFIGVTHRNLNHMEQAISTFQRARDIATKIGWEAGLSTCLCRLGDIKLQQGIHAEAEELLRRSVDATRDSDTGWRLAQALFYSGKCFQAQVRLEHSISALEESCSVYQSLALGSHPGAAEAATLLADSKSALDQKKREL